MKSSVEEKSAFEEAYKRLNKRQKEAVDAIEGPVLVRAGPGTGKTQVLTLRIANILQKTDTAPENILALTFTESGVSAMRERLTSLVGSSAYRVQIQTFHGYCNDVIARFPEEFPRIVGGRVADEAERIKIFEELIESVPLTILRPWGDTFYYVFAILSAIKEIKREGFSPEDFLKAVEKERENFNEIPDKVYESGRFIGKMKGKYTLKEKKITKNEELALLYGEYEKELHTKRLYDYEDMILEVLFTIRKNPEFLLILQEEAHYILADEHQDANASQNEVLTLLASFHDNPNIFVVGDEKQAIYRFQGASIQNFLSFEEKYPSVKVITLEENYRSTQAILDSAHSLIQKSGISSAKLMAEGEKDQNPLRLIELENEEEEAEFLANEIQKQIQNQKEGGEKKEMAILCRDNRDASFFAEVLRQRGIPVVLESKEGGVLEEAKKLKGFFKSLNDPANEEYFAETLFLDFLKLPLLETLKALRLSGRKRIPLQEVIASSFFLREAGVLENEPFLEYSLLFESLVKSAKHISLLSFFEETLEKAGILSYFLSEPSGFFRLEGVQSFFESAKKFSEGKRFPKLTAFLEYLDTLELYRIEDTSKRKTPSSNGVRIMTAHRSKGLEFDAVYIVGAREGKWGGKRERNAFSLPLYGISEEGDEEEEKEGEEKKSEKENDRENDERRLFYVALTRARKDIVILFSQKGQNGKAHIPSRFLEEIGDELLSREKQEVTHEKNEKAKSFLFSPKVSPSYEEYVHELFLSQGLSVTHLNNYLQCPWTYFFVNLLRLPQAENKHQLYGSAMHAALNDLFNRLRGGEEISIEFLLASFKRHLEKMPLLERDFKEACEKGKKALEGYFQTYQETFDSFPALSEFAVRGAFMEIEWKGENIPFPLSGKLDKVEILNDGEVSAVNVVDYKTGKPKSRNEIEGKTKSEKVAKKTGRGNYYRQLVFYKMLLEKNGGQYSMQSGEIDFLEPDEKGKFHREKFIIPDGEVKVLENQIHELAKDIENLSFFERICEEKDCRYCRLGKAFVVQMSREKNPSRAIDR